MLKFFVPTLCCLLLAAPAFAGERPLQFNRDIRGLLFDRCVACHGPDEKHREAELRLDEEEAAKEYAIVPGDAANSELIARITSDDPDMRMPPPSSGKSLTPDEVALLTRWIDEGAHWQPHWAFIAPEKPELPEVKTLDWGRNGIDRFVLARLEEEKLAPAPAASKETLIRRVSIDLTGLPPTLAEIDAFLADDSPDAYEKLVDRLLQSPHYGEQMAVDWLQGARFADSNGYQNDFRREQWPWRDWVIAAFNRNLPFDQFTIEQTAGDMLPDAARDQIVATGFHRNNRTVTEAGSIDEEWRVENTVDRVETTAAVFLGLTMGCCRCHDHKYDPITQKDFYQFYAFFNSIDERGVYTETRGNVAPLIKMDSEQDRETLADFDRRIAATEEEVQTRLSAAVEKFVRDVNGRAGASTAPAPQLAIAFDGSLDAVLAKPLDAAALAPVTPVGPLDSAAPGISAVYTGGEPKFEDGLVGPGIVLQNKPESHIELGASLQPDRDTPFAYALWTRPDATNAALISRMDDAAAFLGWDTLLLPDGRLKIHLIHKWPDDAIALLTKEKLPTGQWSHVAVSYDGSGRAAGLHVFIDGRRSEVEIERDALTGSILADQPVRLGRRSTELYFKGALSRFQWFDRALSPEDVESLVADDFARVGPVNLEDWPDARKEMLRQFVLNSGAGGLRELRDEVVKLKDEKAEYDRNIPTVMTLKDRAEPRETFLLDRGAYDNPLKDEPLTASVPAILPPLPADLPPNRLALARWLVDPANPLVARVQMNRMWQRFFGRGIVKSVDNFGVQCDPPSHPELLDWLAVEFVDSGWDLKAMQKLIVMSAAYQQASDASPQLVARDPENQLLARGPRYRLPAESIRDNALAASGLLSRKIGGPSVKPYQPEGLWEELAGGANEGPYVLSEGEDLYRRSLYTNRKRTVPHTTMSTFDAPSFEICTVKRAITNTPLQSLALLNDITYVEAARKLAERMMTEGGDDSDSRVTHGFRLATGRRPDPTEMRTLCEAVDKYRQVFADDESAAKELLSHGAAPIDETLPVGELAAYTIVGSVILNLDETISKQ